MTLTTSKRPSLPQRFTAPSTSPLCKLTKTVRELESHSTRPFLSSVADPEPSVLAGYARTYIVLPSTIWGIASNPLVEAGIANPYSMQIPAVIRASLARGQAGMVGKGLAYWPSVNIEERASQI